MSTRKTGFLSDDQIQGVLCFAQEVVPDAVLCGGLAMHLYGSPRMTQDVDVLAPAIPVEVDVVRALSFGGATVQTPLGPLLDIIVREDEYQGLYERAYATAKKMRGVPLRLVTAEMLAAMKLVAARPKDAEDLLFLLQQPRTVNRKTAASMIRKELGSFAADEFHRVCDEADWRNTR